MDGDQAFEVRRRETVAELFAGESLLPVIDSLERGLELSSADDENIRPMREGIELTLNRSAQGESR